MTDNITFEGAQIEIMAREKAVVDDSLTVIDGMKGSVMRGIDRILLADERVIFQCTHPAKPNCGWVGVSIRSVVSHQKVHSGRAVQKIADAEIIAANARAVAAEQELNERKNAASARAVKAAATRNENRKVTTPAQQITPVITGAQSKELSKAQNAVVITMNAVNDAIEAYHTAVIHLIKLTNDIPACDPQIIAKAKQYDIIQGALKGVS